MNFAFARRYEPQLLDLYPIQPSLPRKMPWSAACMMWASMRVMAGI